MTDQAPSRMMQLWVAENRKGQLAYDQRLNLILQPLGTLLLIVAPLLVLFAFTPVGRLRVVALSRYGVLVFGVLLLALVVMLVLRTWRYTRLPVQQETLYGGERDRLRRRITLYTASGQPVQFDNFVGGLPRLERDEPYVVYYYDEPTRRTLLSYTPTDYLDTHQQPLL